MIRESSYWKDDLAKQAAGLRRREKQRRWTERSLARVEQTIMLGFYSVRKLVEAKKLSDSTVNRQLPLTTYPHRGRLVTFINNHKIGELYDFDAGKPTSRDVVFVCNQFIHSYVFSVVLNNHGGLCGILVSSDRERNQSLYELRLRDIVSMFEAISQDYPDLIEMQFDSTKGDYLVASGNTASASANP
jgi:hypothetical protein